MHHCFNTIPSSAIAITTGISMRGPMRLALSIFALLISAQAAVAQITLNSPPTPPSTFSDQTIRVTTSFRTPLVADNQTAPDTKSQEAARRELYRMAENECG